MLVASVSLSEIFNTLTLHILSGLTHSLRIEWKVKVSPKPSPLPVGGSQLHEARLNGQVALGAQLYPFRSFPHFLSRYGPDSAEAARTTRTTAG